MRSLPSIVPIRYRTPAALALTAASACSAGIINPGGGAHIWTGAVNTTWGNAGNWTTGMVPDDGESAIIDGGPANIFLSANTESLASLYVSGGLALSSNGHQIIVTQGIEHTTVNGVDSRLYLNAAPGGVAAFATSGLDLETEGRLQLAGGRARISEQLTMTGAASITGNGWVDVLSSAPVAFNGLGGGSISAIGGELLVSIGGGGAIAVPPTLNIVGAGSSLVIDAPFFIPIIDVNMDADTTFEVAQPWELAGAIQYNGADGVSSTIAGAHADIDGAIEVNNGILDIQAGVLFRVGSHVEVGSSEELILSAAHAADPGATATVQHNGVLRVNASQGASAWHGDIALGGATLEINAPQDGEWDLHGDLEMGSFAGLRSSLAGTAPISLWGDVELPGLGGEFNTVVYLRTGASIDLAQPTTRLVVNDWFSPYSATAISGDGRIDITENGLMRCVEPMTLAVDVANSGDFETTGSAHGVGYTYINGAFTQTETGRLNVDIAGPTNLERDVYEVVGEIELAGEIVVNLANGYAPMPGESFEVMVGHTNLNGAFDSVAGDEGFVVSYPGNTVVLTFVGCVADLTGDGVVDSSDLASILAGWGMAGDTDLNADGVTDSSDLAIVLAAWGDCM